MKIGPLAAICALSLSAAILLSACESEKPAAGLDAAVDPTAGPIVNMKMTTGDIKIQVYKRDAPITSDNFLDLVNRHFYDGLTFHRYEPGFVIQGGDPLGNGTGGFIDPQTKRERTIRLEKTPNLTHGAAGVVAMARNNNPDSASSQFYITLAPAPFLDQPPGYAAFGKVTSGMDSVLKLRQGDKILSAQVEK